MAGQIKATIKKGKADALFAQGRPQYEVWYRGRFIDKFGTKAEALVCKKNVEAEERQKQISYGAL